MLLQECCRHWVLFAFSFYPAGVPAAGAYESAPSGATLATTSTLKDADARMTSDVTVLSEDLAALYAGLFKPVVCHLTLPTRAHMLVLRPLGLLSPPFRQI